jgi:hypothetical protein
MELGFFPGLLAGLTAGWFGWMAHRAGRNRTLWAVGGAAFALITSTIVFGLGRSVSIPYSAHERAVDHFEWVVSAVALIGVVGWLLTLGLHRHHLVLWRTIKPESSQTADSKPASPAPRKEIRPVGR